MVKFAKTLKRELIPEWSEGYVDYKTLKQTLNQISQSQPVHGPRGDISGASESSEALLEVSRSGSSSQDRCKKTRGPSLIRSKSDGAPGLRKLLSCKYIDVSPTSSLFQLIERWWSAWSHWSIPARTRLGVDGLLGGG
jgi:hypothetical protein